MGIAHSSSLFQFSVVAAIRGKIIQQIAMQVAIGFATAQRAIAIGQTQAVDSWHTEVTQRQEAQAKLQASQEFLHSIYEGAANAIFVVDVLPSGEFRFAGLNPAHEQLSGLRSEDIKGKSPEQVLPPTAAAAVSANYARCVQAETTISYEECLPVEGKEAWWLTTLTPLRDAQSKIYQLTGTSINITDRKQAEEKLTRQKEFLRNVINTNPNLIAVKDWQGRFRLVNQALADMYCTTVEDLIGKTDRDFNSHPAEVEHYLHDDRQVMSSLQSKFIPEEILTSPSGEVHYLQTIKKPLISPDGRTRYVLITATDITDRKRAEQERDREAAAKHHLFEHIEQQNQTLEAKVQERTAQLSIANEQLQQEVRERKADRRGIKKE
jgi:PAS domain S-box-containing protein